MVGGEMALQHLAVLEQLRTEPQHEFIIMRREGRIVRIRRLATERRHVELLQQNAQMRRVGFVFGETGRARLSSRTDRRAGEDGGDKNFTQGCPLKTRPL